MHDSAAADVQAVTIVLVGLAIGVQSSTAPAYGHRGCPRPTAARRVPAHGPVIDHNWLVPLGPLRRWCASTQETPGSAAAGDLSRPLLGADGAVGVIGRIGVAGPVEAVDLVIGQVHAGDAQVVVELFWGAGAEDD